MGTELKVYVAWQPVAGIDKIFCGTQYIEVYNIEAESIREARCWIGAACNSAWGRWVAMCCTPGRDCSIDTMGRFSTETILLNSRVHAYARQLRVKASLQWVNMVSELRLCSAMGTQFCWQFLSLAFWFLVVGWWVLCISIGKPIFSLCFHRKTFMFFIF